MKSVFARNSTHFRSGVTIEASSCIRSIFSKLAPSSIVFLDLDDTVGRVNQAMGLDAWFRLRVNQFAAEGHTESEALNNAIALYNQVQMASKKYVSVEADVNIANEIEALKAKGIHVLGLTARNHFIADKTHELLATLGVSFSVQALEDSEFYIGEAKVVIKQGVIFANGQNKGVCLEIVDNLNLFSQRLHHYPSLHFVDDSHRNCGHVRESAEKLNLADKFSIYHYRYAEEHLPFCETHKMLASIQEKALLETKQLLNDEEAQSLHP